MITVSDNNYLNEIWKRWCIARVGQKHYLNKDYSRIARRIQVAQSFEDWLWAQGGSIIRNNHKCYLQFVDEEDALVFRLTHS